MILLMRKASPLFIWLPGWAFTQAYVVDADDDGDLLDDDHDGDLLCRDGQEEIALMLVKAGANLHATNQEGYFSF